MLFAAVLLIGLVVFAFTQGHDWGGPGGNDEGGGRPPMQPGGMRGMFGMYGDMSPEVITKVKTIMESGEKLAKPHKDKAIAIQAEIQTAFLAKKVDVKKVNALIAKEGAENIAARQALTASLIKLKPILTEEQLKRMILTSSATMGMRRRMGGGPGGFNQNPNPGTKPIIKPGTKPTAKPVKK